MAIPSGSGTEVLKRLAGVRANNSTDVITVDTNHIITVISMAFFGTQTHTSTVRVTIDVGGTDYILLQQVISGLGTFVYNDKIVLHPTDVLTIAETENYNMNYFIYYIEQDWSS